MRKLKTFGGALLAGTALLAIMAGSAYAKTDLVLKEHGVPVAKGAPAIGSFYTQWGSSYSEYCVDYSSGTLTANDSTKDKATFTKSIEAGCGVGASISGFLTSAQLTTAGAVTFKANITVMLPGSCAYAVKKFTASFTPGNGEEVEGVAEVPGKLGKGSSKSCAKTHTFSAVVSLQNAEYEPFESELT
jgi:hypothetical protein